MAMESRDWDQSYRERQTPWDTGLRSRELARVLDEEPIRPGRAVELGCGTGTNAVFLAQRGFDVTGFDLSAVALDEARRKTANAGVSVEFIEADLCRLEWTGEPFDFLFDRGCYHCARRGDLAGYQETVRRLSRAGSRYLVLAGNAREQTEQGPPRVTEAEIRADLGGLFDVEWIREFRFEDAGGVDGPLGWSCLLVRRNEG